MGHEEDYSDYSRHINTTINGLTLIMGFIFTSITLLLTRLNDPSSLGSQLLLLFLAFLFYLDASIVEHLSVDTLYYCKRLPPQTRRIAVRTALIFLSSTLFGLAVPFMFYLFGLVYLSVTAGVIWFAFGLAELVVIYRPLWKYRRSHVK